MQASVGIKMVTTNGAARKTTIINSKNMKRFKCGKMSHIPTNCQASKQEESNDALFVGCTKCNPTTILIQQQQQKISSAEVPLPPIKLLRSK